MIVSKGGLFRWILQRFRSPNHRDHYWIFKVDFVAETVEVNKEVIPISYIKSIWIQHFEQPGALSELDIMVGDRYYLESVFTDTPKNIESLARDISETYTVPIRRN